MKAAKVIPPSRRKQPEFVRRAERALRRVAKGLVAESRARNIPIVVWEDGKVVERLP